MVSIAFSSAWLFVLLLVACTDAKIALNGENYIIVWFMISVGAFRGPAGCVLALSRVLVIDRV